MMSKKHGIILRAGKIWFFVVLYLLVFLDCCYAREPERITYTGPVYAMGETMEKPPEILEQSGKRYQLVSAEIKEAKKEGVLTYVTVHIPYELEGEQEPPQSAVATLKDKAAGSEYEREVHLLEVTEKAVEWRSDFSFEITVHQYDSNQFLLGELEIPASANFLDYEEAFLQYLNLPLDSYKIDRVEWDGEPYENEGIMCRNAVAYGEKRIRHVEVKYGGQIRTPEVLGKRYEAVYEEITLELETKNEGAEMEAETTCAVETDKIRISETKSESVEAENNPADGVLQWIKEHIWVTAFSGLFLFGILMWLLLIYLSTKREREGKAGD